MICYMHSCPGDLYKSVIKTKFREAFAAMWWKQLRPAIQNSFVTCPGVICRGSSDLSEPVSLPLNGDEGAEATGQ